MYKIRAETGMEKLLTVDELSEWLRVKPRTIYQWIHEGYIPVVKLGSLVRFQPVSVTEWLQKREEPGRMKRRIDYDIA